MLSELVISSLDVLLCALLIVFMRIGSRARAEADRIALEVKDTVQSLRASEARTTRIFETNVIGICFSDARGVIFDANDAFLKLVHGSRSELKSGNMRWTDITPLEYRALDLR